MHGHAVEHIGRRIVSGQLLEGETIDLQALEAELDVSRTVVREALKVLDTKGLVGARQRRGTFVRPRSEWNLLDGDILRWQFSERTDSGFLESLHEVRGVVEPAGARLAAQRRSADDLQALERALEAMAAAESVEEATGADLAFHRALLVATHNEFLARMETVIEAGLTARDKLVHGAAHVADPLPRHRTVYEAVRRGQHAAAERAMRDLLQQAIDDLSNIP